MVYAILQKEVQILDIVVGDGVVEYRPTMPLEEFRDIGISVRVLLNAVFEFVNVDDM